MMKAIVCDEREIEYFQQKGLQKLLGYYLILRWQSAGGAPVHSSVRKLRPILGVADYNTVSVILAKLQENGLIEMQARVGAGTDIYFPDFLSVRKNKTLEKENPLFPHTLITPKSETLNNNNLREINLSTKCAEKDGQPKRKLNTLQQFSNAVIVRFEDLKTKEQKAIWFKRNCRNLADILKFCGNDIELALETINACAVRLDKLGFVGGYEAVCRNLSMYYQAACKTLNRSEKCK